MTSLSLSNISNFPHHWLEALFHLVELPFELAFSPACHSTENWHNGYHINGGGNLHVGLVDGLMAHDEKICESSLVSAASVLFVKGTILYFMSMIMCRWIGQGFMHISENNPRTTSAKSLHIKMSFILPTKKPKTQLMPILQQTLHFLFYLIRYLFKLCDFCLHVIHCLKYM